MQKAAAWLHEVHHHGLHEQATNPLRAGNPALAEAVVLAPVPGGMLPYYLRSPHKIYFGLHGSPPSVDNPHGAPVLIEGKFEPGGACTCRAPDSNRGNVTGSDEAQPVDWLGNEPGCLGRCLQVTLWMCESFPLTMDELLYSFRQHFGVERHVSVYPPDFSRVVAPPEPPETPDAEWTPAIARRDHLLPETRWLEEQMRHLPDPSLYEPFFPGWVSRRMRRQGALDLQDPRRTFDLTAARCLRRIQGERTGRNERVRPSHAAPE